MGRVASRLVIGFGIAILLLAGCSSGGGGAKVKVAEQRVSDKQKALTDAQSQLASKTTAFCQSSARYITALDHYGDVLHQTAPTVGDVKEAGADLAKPREDVMSNAQAVTDAQQQVVKAEQELADARAALASAQAAAASQPPPTAAPSPTPSATPLVSSATVNRVKQADTDFTAAQQGITDQTPLVQAAQQFNAAVVALEMSWLKLFVEAGCLTDEQQKQAEAAVHNYTSALQKSLTEAGYFQGTVDGVYGPTTVDAVRALQKAHSLPVTGTVDKATDAALQSDLQAKGGAAAQQSTASTAAVQQTLKLAGYWTGPVDGQWTPALTDALKSFQKALGVPQTGTVDAATIAALEHAIANAKNPAPSSTPAAPGPSAT
jgi:murein L,D-transpeptidase YcbB/YkuD